ncbi:ComF family protein [Gemella cuniculi]|uniref:ComF family protein n=1 Tax=Gemella cuniculi TaxID=150240 RepID=UPI0003FB36DE|nr:ComF family protein [Gemella cuniculi]
MKCEFCRDNIKEVLSFENIFSKKEKLILCNNCKKYLDINIITVGEYELYYFCDYEFVKEIIYKIKYFGDVQSAIKFKILFNKFFELYNFDLVTIVPSNNTRKYIRGFNHIEEICKLCDVKFESTLACDYREKQSKLHKKRTIHNFEVLTEFKQNSKEFKNILIMDDIFTSGNTLVSCAKKLEQYLPNLKISFLTLAKSGEKMDKKEG